MIAHFQVLGASPLFSIYAAQDSKNSSEIILYMSQSGISLPDRDYYLKTGAKDRELREEYVKHITKMFKLCGLSDSDANIAATDVLSVETKLAEAYWTRLENRDPHATYNKFHFNELELRYPGLELKSLLDEMSIPAVDSIIVRQPSYFTFLNEELGTINLASLRNYLKWRTIVTLTPDLSSDFVNADFDFFDTRLRGVNKIKPRWKRMQEKADYALGELIGKEFVDRHFSPEAKKKCLDMVNSFIVAYGNRIDKLDWMSAETKAKAKHKLSVINVKIGYPDVWKDYSALEIVEGDHIGNMIRARKWRYNHNVSKLGKPVDKNEWYLNPQMVNAYYQGTNVEIVFPAGILQPPIFNVEADDAVNYGGIGGVIGHEITHGFDDRGRLYDSNGNLNDWWTAEDANRFKAKASVLVEQYNTFTVCDTINVNGEYTLSENIADLGGVAIAFDAFKNTDQYKKGKPIDGLKPEQRFFLAWARLWSSNTTDKEQARRILVDSHSPDKYRVTGPFSHLDSFYDAFGIKPGDPLYRADSLRVVIW